MLKYNEKIWDLLYFLNLQIYVSFIPANLASYLFKCFPFSSILFSPSRMPIQRMFVPLMLMYSSPFAYVTSLSFCDVLWVFPADIFLFSILFATKHLIWFFNLKSEYSQSDLQIFGLQTFSARNESHITNILRCKCSVEIAHMSNLPF